MPTTAEAPLSTVDLAGGLTGRIVSEVRAALARLDEQSVCDLTEDVELAEVIGRLKALTMVLLSVVD